jgi:dolichol-phosphate mannosyltransferase
LNGSSNKSTWLVSHKPREAYDVSIVIPTLNERDNVLALIDDVQRIRGDKAWEMLFVDDDSSDDTPAVVEEAGSRDPSIRVLRRRKKGLASAIADGAKHSASSLIVVMDADLQHDTSLLPSLVSALEDEAIDLAIASRYVAKGGTRGWSAYRQLSSTFATWLFRALTTTNVKDPLSGFFAIRRSTFEKLSPLLSGSGSKFLAEVIAVDRTLVFQEFPYVFRTRRSGRSKHSLGVVYQFILLLAAHIRRRALEAIRDLRSDHNAHSG